MPPMNFLKWSPNHFVDRDEVLHKLWAILRTTFDSNFFPGQFRSLSYDVIRGIASDRFFKEMVFSGTKPAAIDRNGVINHDLGQQMTISDLLTLRLDLSKVIQGH